MQLGQTKARTIQKNLETSSKHSVLVQFKARLEERIAVLSNTITRNRSLQHLPATCIEKAVCMKTNEKLFHRVSACKISSYGAETEVASTKEYQACLIPQSNNRTRIAEKQSKSWFSSSRITRTMSSSCRTWIRPKRSAKGRRSWSPTWATRRSSSFAKPLPRNNAPDCALYCEIGIVYCSCGRSLKPSQGTKHFDKKNYDAWSIPGYVIRKNLTRGAKHGASEGQRMYCKAKGKLANPSMVEIWIPWQSTEGVDRYICRRSHSTDDMCAWFKELAGLKFDLRPKIGFHPRVMFHLAPHSTLNTSTSSLSPTSPVLLSSSSPNPDLLSTHPYFHCEHPRQDGHFYGIPTSRSGRPTVEDACRWQDATSCQFPAALSKRILPMVARRGPCAADHVPPCWGKPASTKVVVTTPFWKDGTMMTITASLCQTLGGLRSKLFRMTNLHWKTTPIFAATEGRDRNEKKWVLSLNKEGVQGPLHQRPGLVKAKRELKRLHDEHVMETSEGNTPVHPIQRSRQRRNQQFEGLEEIWLSSRSSNPLKSQGETCGIQHLRLHQLKGNRLTSVDWTAAIFLVQRCFFFFRLQEIEFLGNRPGV